VNAVGAAPSALRSFDGVWFKQAGDGATMAAHKPANRCLVNSTLPANSAVDFDQVPLHRPAPLPDQRLVRAGQHLHALRLWPAPRRRAQPVGVGPHCVSQHVRGAGIARGRDTRCRSQ
jgi:hypothetical protein